MGKRNILLFFPALPSHAATARRPMAARSWLAAPKSPQILANPPMPREMPRITVMMVAKYGFTMSLRNPSLTSFGFSPGSSQNSWNMKRASLVAVSREVRQKAE